MCEDDMTVGEYMSFIRSLGENTVSETIHRANMDFSLFLMPKNAEESANEARRFNDVFGLNSPCHR